MIRHWNSQSFTTRFSAPAFAITAVLGLVSMGALGGGLYYPVSFLFKSYPSLNNWHSDWVWPAMIVSGMFWSLGFILGGIAWHYLHKLTTSKILLRIIYGFILWLWAAVIWYIIILNNVTPL